MSEVQFERKRAGSLSNLRQIERNINVQINDDGAPHGLTFVDV